MGKPAQAGWITAAGGAFEARLTGLSLGQTGRAQRGTRWIGYLDHSSIAIQPWGGLSRA
jgi:hypothetical protein